jgi:Do/DeqQ family serine protease
MRLSVIILCLLAAAAPASAQLLGRETPRSTEQIRLSFAPVVREVAPAVVNVYSERVLTARSRTFEDEFFQRFFGDVYGGVPRERVSRSLGSGVIVRPDGVVVTNNHVVAGATELHVVLADRREFNATLILADERTDLAVLKIDTRGESLPTLAFDEDGDAEVGDLVLAIGNPFGVGQTVTQGIVSALGRSDVGVSDYAFFIQTDAAINPGNSGGALVDLDGDLIGINTAIFSRSGGSEGVGFAIPAELVARVVDGALSEGRIVRPWFGAQGQTVTPDLASTLDLDRPRGVLVSDVFPDGPADGAGVRAGDVVLAVDGAEVDSETALRFRLATRRVGERADVTVWRDGRERTLRLEAAPPPESPRRDQRAIDGASPFAGAEVANLSPAFNEELGIDLFRSGVAVMSVRRGSAADYYGFQPGDVIEEVNGEPVATTAELERSLRASEGARSWSLIVERGGRRYSRTFRF